MGQWSHFGIFFLKIHISLVNTKPTTYLGNCFSCFSEDTKQVSKLEEFVVVREMRHNLEKSC